jgi:hypothetical protein
LGYNYRVRSALFHLISLFSSNIFRLPNQTYFDVINGTGAVAFSTDAKYLATLSQQSPQVKVLFDFK